MPDPDVGPPSDDHARKEAYTTALYVAVCLLAALTAVKDDNHVRTVQIVWGTTIGLTLAHWFAFRLSARYVAGGTFHPHDARMAGSQLVGAAVVGLMATVPVVLLPASAELDVVRFELAGFITVVAFAVARGAGAPMRRSLLYAATTLLAAAMVVFVKNALVGH